MKSIMLQMKPSFVLLFLLDLLLQRSLLLIKATAVVVVDNDADSEHSKDIVPNTSSVHVLSSSSSSSSSSRSSSRRNLDVTFDHDSEEEEIHARVLKSPPSATISSKGMETEISFAFTAMNGEGNTNNNDSNSDNDITEKCANNSTKQYYNSFPSKLLSLILQQGTRDTNMGLDNNDDNGDDDYNYDSLFCWLYNLKLIVPDEHFRSGIFSVSIHDMVCTAFEIKSLSSSYNPSNNNLDAKDDDDGGDDPSLSFSVQGVSATCSGRYKSGLTGGTLTVTVETIQNKTSIDTETSIKSFYLPMKNTTQKPSLLFKDNHTLQNERAQKILAPYSGNVTLCQTNLMVPKKGGIIFSGSVSAMIIRLFSSSIANHVTNALSSELCPSIKSGVESSLNRIFRNMDDYLQKLIEQENDEQVIASYQNNDNFVQVKDDQNKEIEESKDMMTWDSDMFMLKNMLIGFNSFLASHLNQGLVLSFFDMIGWTGRNSSGTNDCSLSTDCGFFFRGINGLIRHATQSGSINITTDSKQFSFSVQNLGEIQATLHNFELYGLDAFTKLSMIPKNDHMMSIMIKSLNGFHFDGTVELHVDPVEDGIIHGGSLREIFDVSFNVSSVSLMAQLDAGLSRSKLQSISIGDLNKAFSTNQSDAMRLVLSTLAYANFTEVKPRVNVDYFQLKPISQHKSDDDLLENSIDEMINHIIQLFLNEYSELWTESLIAFGDGPIKQKLNEGLQNVIFKHQMQPTETDTMSMNVSDEHFHFNESSLVDKVHSFFASDSWIDRLNIFITCVASFMQKILMKPKSIVQKSNSTFNTAFEEFSISNVGRINTFDILKAFDESRSTSGFASHWSNDTSDSFLQQIVDQSLLANLSATLGWSLLDLAAVFNISTAIFGIRNQIGTKIEYDPESLNSITLYEGFKNIFSPIIAPITKDSGFYDFVGSISSIDLGINVTAQVGANDPRYYNYVAAVDNELSLLATSALSSIYVISQNVLNAILQIGISMNSISRISQVEDSNTNDGTIMWWISIGIALILFHACYILTSNGTPARQHATNDMNVTKNGQHGVLPVSLASNQNIPYIIRVLVPLIIVTTIVIFIVSNLCTGASVYIETSGANSLAGSKTISIPNAFTFSLGKTVSEMYQAKVYTLMTLVLVFSGIWPYVKLLLMLTAWFSNEKWVSFQRREKLLMWLDAFGKYSLVDSFVLVLMLVSFRFHVDLDLPIVNVIDSFVIPKDGFYTFLCATVLSLVVGHLVTFLHRYSSMPEMGRQNEKESIQSHVFENRYPRRLIQMSKHGRWIWVSFNLIAVILLALGAVQKCFIFTFKGAAGLVLGNDREAHYSLISLGVSLPMSVKDPSAIGIMSIQWTYIFFSLVMPFASIVIVNILFYVPMTLRGQNKVFVLAEICNAWSAIEVFLLSVFASMLELSQFAAFMVGDHCNFLKGSFMKDLFQEEDTCFNVEAKLGYGSIILGCGVVMQCIIMSVSLGLCHQTIEERMHRSGLVQQELSQKSNTDGLFFKMISICLFQSSVLD